MSQGPLFYKNVLGLFHFFFSYFVIIDNFFFVEKKSEVRNNRKRVVKKICREKNEVFIIISHLTQKYAIDIT